MSRRCPWRYALGLLAVALSGASQARTLPPRDECAADASFRAFRTELLKAIDRKDSRYLLSIVAPDIKVDFGGGEGRAALVAAWDLNQPTHSRIWAELKTILDLGCTHHPDTMSVPYLFGRFPNNLDAFESLVVIRPNTALRAAPQPAARVRTRLSWDIVTLVDPSYSNEAKWLKVRTANGQSGYVEGQAVRSPIDYRAIFEKRDGRWMMTALIAGD